MEIHGVSHPTARIETPVPFDPNVLESGEAGAFARWPVLAGPALSAADYASAFMSLGDMVKGGSFVPEVSKVGVAGAIDTPEMQSFARLSIMPNAFQRGMVQWPGFPAATLKKIARDHYIVSTILEQRVADVLRYATPSTHPWKPGWAIEMRDGVAKPTEFDLADIKDATRFVLNCNSEFGWDARRRDEAQ